MDRILILLGNFFFRWRDTIFSLILFFGFFSLTKNSDFFLFFYFGDFKIDILFSILGFIFIIIGVFIRMITIGFIYIKRAGVQKKIYAEVLFQKGLFSHSRNPLYLGNLFVVTGIIISINQYLFWFVILPLFYFIYFCIIKAEEDFLSKKFKEDYLNYYKNVPRLFFGNFSLFPESFKDLEFSFKQVVKVEHSSHFLILLSLVIINLLKFHFRYSLQWNHPFFYFLFFIFSILVIYQVISYFLKINGYLDVKKI